MKKVASTILCILLLAGCMLTASANSSFSVTFSVYEQVNNRYILPAALTAATDEDTPLSVLLEKELEVVHSGGYVSSINGLEQGEYGVTSGWIYKINGVMPNIPATAYKLKANDKVEWVYSISEETPKTTTTRTSRTVGPLPTRTKTTETIPSLVSSVSQSSISSTAPTTTLAVATKAPTTAKIPTKTLSKDVDNMVKVSLDYLYDNPGNFTALAMRLFGDNPPRSLRKSLIEEASIQNAANLANITDLERIAINLAALGEDPNNVNGNNICKQIFESEDIFSQGINGVIFALLTLPHAKLEGTEKNTSASLMELILQNQKQDGSFSLTYDTTGDVDITAMAITALSAYKTQPLILNSLDRALNWLALQQNRNGSFNNNAGVPSSESTAQVIIALSSMGIDTNDSRFMKNQDMFSALTAFFNKTGFSHERGGDVNSISTEQALLAIAAYQQKINPYGHILLDDSQNSFTVLKIVGLVFLSLLFLALIVFVLINMKKKARGSSKTLAVLETPSDIPKGYMPEEPREESDDENT